ncbi:MAG TPA: radical SAM protein [Candidatus Cloacimonadota bacterium]|nr:radical SAM protein [Candidatus Cloacimonadota bacterium]HPB08734.1 radical SAM protein [Candidatus Cloacimonadota bacterium]HPL23497.1 radical SAM protein [Candidatus Cloacimonadota bacterium]HQO44325.1 radical SAM protein [Candidatus Cloacimonadota bacterium]
MLSLIPRIVAYWFMKHLGFPRLLPMNYTVSLLYTCNSRCSTCNVWKKKARDFSVEEYVKTFKSIGRSPYWVTFSGGEPFLRQDLVKIVTTIYKISRPRIINIPTNGILTQGIAEKVEAIAKACPKAQIIINISIDGVENQHDEIRKVPGNYKKALATLHRLQSLKLPNLAVGIHTVISQFNVDSFPGIATELMRLEPDSYITEIAEERVELDTIGANITPSLISYKSAIDFLIHRIKNGSYKGMSKITMAFRIEYYNLVKKIMRDQRQIIPCYSGIASAQISPDGDVWTCCVKAKSLGNLRKEKYNFRRIWFHHEAELERRSIHKRECWCPLANAAYTNMLMDIPTLFRVFWRSFIKWWH